MVELLKNKYQQLQPTLAELEAIKVSLIKIFPIALIAMPFSRLMKTNRNKNLYTSCQHVNLTYIMSEILLKPANIVYCPCGSGLAR